MLLIMRSTLPKIVLNVSLSFCRKQVLKKGYTNYLLGHQNTVYAFCSEECMDEFLLRSEFYSSVEVKNEDSVVKQYIRLTPQVTVNITVLAH